MKNTLAKVLKQVREGAAYFTQKSHKGCKQVVEHYLGIDRMHLWSIHYALVFVLNLVVYQHNQT